MKSGAMNPYFADNITQRFAKCAEYLQLALNTELVYTLRAGVGPALGYLSQIF